MIKKLLYWKTILWTFVLGLFIVGSVLFYLGDKSNMGERNFMRLLSDKLSGEEKPVNLIICTTPLQMVIAEKIIEQHPNEKFYFVLMTLAHKNDIYESYLNRVEKKADKSYSFYLNPYSSKISEVLLLMEIKLKGLLLPKVKTTFISSIDNSLIRTFISSSSSEIKTFDDGTINLVSNSPYLSNEEDRKLIRIFNSSLSTSKVRELSTEHFTIFKDLPNIMEVERDRRIKTGSRHNKLTISNILLFNNNIIPSTQIKDTTKILLGTKEIHLKETSEKVIKHLGIKYTTKHPSQTYELDNATTLKSNLLIEDYLLKEIEKNPNTQYEIYTFFSGAALTVKDFPNVKVFAIKPSSFPDDYWLNPVYELFEKANIPILEFDDRK